MISPAAVVAASSAVLLALGGLVAALPLALVVPLAGSMGGLALAADLAARIADRLERGRPLFPVPRTAGRHCTTRHGRHHR